MSTGLNFYFDTTAFALADLEEAGTEYEIQVREPDSIFWRASEHNIGLIPDEFEAFAKAYYRAVREWPEASYRIVKTKTFKHTQVLDV